jgi:hypothetical protein
MNGRECLLHPGSLTKDAAPCFTMLRDRPHAFAERRPICWKRLASELVQLLFPFVELITHTLLSCDIG